MNQTYTINELDLDEAPELTEVDFDRAIYRVAGKTVELKTWQDAVQKRMNKQKISITIDPDVLAFFRAKSGGKGYQTLINAALRESMYKDSFTATLRQVLRDERHV